MILTRTPFRLPLGGGGTDLPAYYQKFGGFLITAAINKYMFINVNKPAVVNKIKINYSRVEIVEPDQVQTIRHEIVREVLKYLNIHVPMEISSMADLSAGTGMGSSSSYTVGLLRGLNVMVRRFVSVHELAEEACKIEIDRIGKPIGKQDQYSAAFGGINVLKINNAGKVDVIPLQLHNEVIRDFENHLMMFYTEIERDANDILAEQSAKLRKGDLETGRQWEGGKEGEALGAKREEPKRENKTVQAMHEIKEIGYRSKNALENGDYDLFGKLMHQHWMIKKRISTKMSNPEIDRWYEIAMNSGAIGGKIMGAGGGGFFLFCVENGKRKQLRSTLENTGLRYMDFRFDFEGSKVIANV